MTSHDDGAVVKRARRVENADEQVVTQLGVELHATVRDVLQADGPFDDDQRACLRRSERGSCEYDLVVNAFAKLPAVPRERNAKTVTERDQSLPDLRLEQDDDGDADV